MKLSELKYDEKSRVYINPEKVIDYSDGEENEQYVLDCLRSAEDTSIFSKDLLKSIKDWPSEYHFTTYRPNIVRPFKIKKGQKVLEIGAGTGAITRYLGETGADIIAVEGGCHGPSVSPKDVEICRTSRLSAVMLKMLNSRKNLT
ncbi:hypothetical protein [Maribacter halichondriae]|uniref:hypothetical protein n=1 Tax=Maribacter halichondriae TaxID=2980554 RepID=UPI00235826B9|nr:hypothetical protein [Maribacter sp. Hal144]